MATDPSEGVSLRFRMSCSDPKHGTDHYAVYLVDRQGHEELYVEHSSWEEHLAWRQTDPVWKRAQSALISRLLENPGTRDLVLKINIKGAIDEGKPELAMELARHLSPAARAQLFSAHEEPDDSDGEGSSASPG